MTSLSLRSSSAQHRPVSCDFEKLRRRVLGSPLKSPAIAFQRLQNDLQLELRRTCRRRLAKHAPEPMPWSKPILTLPKKKKKYIYIYIYGAASPDHPPPSPPMVTPPPYRPYYASSPPLSVWVGGLFTWVTPPHRPVAWWWVLGYLTPALLSPRWWVVCLIPSPLPVVWWCVLGFGFRVCTPALSVVWVVGLFRV